VFNDAMILSYDANLGRMEFSERTADAMSYSNFQSRPMRLKKGRSVQPPPRYGLERQG
jgi:hypothetical protein